MNEIMVNQFRNMLMKQEGLKLHLGGLVSEIIDNYFSRNNIEQNDDLLWDASLRVNWIDEAVILEIENHEEYNLALPIDDFEPEPHKMKIWTEGHRGVLTKHLETVYHDWRIELGDIVTGVVQG